MHGSISPEEATGWMKIIGMVAGGFVCFVSGIISATCIVLNKVNGFDKEIISLRNEHLVLKNSHVVDQEKCTLYRCQMEKELHNLDKFHQTWTIELASARDQRIKQGTLLEHLSKAVVSGNGQVVRLHERIDDIHIILNADNPHSGRKSKRPQPPIEMQGLRNYIDGTFNATTAEPSAQIVAAE
jgi:hypothetical protein